MEKETDVQEKESKCAPKEAVNFSFPLTRWWWGSQGENKHKIYFRM